MPFPKIKVFYQFSTHWCAHFASAHYLTVLYSRFFKMTRPISPWRVVITVFRAKGYKHPFASLSMGYREIFEVLNKKGVTFKNNKISFRRYPPLIKNLALDKLDKFLINHPVLAIIYNCHAVVIVEKKGSDKYEIIDSQSKKGYRTIRKKDITSLFVLSQKLSD